MRISLNGKTETLDSAMTLGRLLTQLKLEPVRVAVEINEDLVPRKAFAKTVLHEGDRVEVVTLVGGG